MRLTSIIHTCFTFFSSPPCLTLANVVIHTYTIVLAVTIFNKQYQWYIKGDGAKRYRWEGYKVGISDFVWIGVLVFAISALENDIFIKKFRIGKHV